MQPGLLKTKYYIPPTRPEFVPRPHLIGKLDSGLSKKLTLVSAPAGFGKTTLLSEWIGSLSRPAAWLTLDTNENDPVQFWLYFIGALQRISDRVGDAAINILQAIPLQPLESILTIVINEITDNMPEFIIVLDDYHLISAQPIHESITFMIEHSPLNMHLVISSRTDPPLPLTRIRANNLLAEFRAEDLRFNFEESKTFFDRLLTNISEEGISEIFKRTEGWIVGLQMAFLSMKGREDISGFITSFGASNRYILDYLTDEVLNQQNENVKAFLLQTSVLDRMTGAICDALTGRSDGQYMLELLEAINLFVTPLDDERYWYRYHHLFGELLRVQLSREQPDLLPSLYTRASVWFEREGLLTEAFQYALLGGEPERAAKLSELVAMEMVAQNKAVTVYELISKLPDDIVRNHLELCVAGAWASLVTRRWERVELFSRQALVHLPENELDKMDDNKRNFYSHLLTIRANLARFKGEFNTAIELSLKALEYAKETDHMVLSTATLSLGLSYWNNGNFQLASDYIKKAAEQSKDSSNYFVALTSMCYWAETAVQMGNLKKAADILRETIKFGTDWGGGHPLPATGYSFVALSNILREWNRLDEAEGAVSQGIELGETSTESELKVRAYISFARLKQAKNDLDAVTDSFKKAYAVEPVFATLKNEVSAWEAKLWLLQGKLDEAARWAREHEYLLESNREHNFAEEIQFLVLLRINIARGESEDMLPHLKLLLFRMEKQSRMTDLIEVLSLKSIAFAHLNRTEEAVVSLERALSIASEEGYIRIFVDHGKPMQQLLRHASRRSKSKDYISILLKAFQSEEQQGSPISELFNEQEKAILRLMSAGLSNREISK
jgi:LuxR family maltose regulon positive regulatory protein